MMMMIGDGAMTAWLLLFCVKGPRPEGAGFLNFWEGWGLSDPLPKDWVRKGLLWRLVVVSGTCRQGGGNGDGDEDEDEEDEDDDDDDGANGVVVKVITITLMMMMMVMTTTMTMIMMMAR